MTNVYKIILIVFLFCFVFTFVNINYQITKKNTQDYQLEAKNELTQQLGSVRNKEIQKVLNSFPQKRMKIPPILWMTSKRKLNVTKHKGF